MCRPTQVHLLIFIALVFGLSACAPSTSSGQATLLNLPTSTVPLATQLSTAIPLPITKPVKVTSTPMSVLTLQPTATQIQLPYIRKSGDYQYCKQSPVVELSFSGAQGLSDDEIAAELMSLFLDYFNNPQAPGRCRIDGYSIDLVDQVKPETATQIEPKGNFVRYVGYSIKLIQVPNIWMSLSGNIDQQNWFHTGGILAITKVLKSDSEGGYTMKFAYP